MVAYDSFVSEEIVAGSVPDRLVDCRFSWSSAVSCPIVDGMVPVRLRFTCTKRFLPVARETRKTSHQNAAEAKPHLGTYFRFVSAPMPGGRVPVR